MANGLLDYVGGLYQDPRAAGLTGMASGLLSAGGPQQFPVSFGQAASRGLLSGFELWSAAEEARRRGQLIDAQTQHLAAQNQALTEQQRVAQERAAFFAAPTPATATTPMLPLPGGMSLPGGGQANAYTGQFVPPQPQVDPMIARLTDPRWVAQAKALGVDLTPLYTQLTQPQKREQGSTYVDPVTQRSQFFPRLGEGQQFTPGAGISNIPGAVSAEAERAAAIEREKAQYGAPVTVQPPGGGPAGLFTPVQISDLLRRGAPGPTAPTAAAAPRPGVGGVQTQSAGQAAAQKAVDEVFAKDMVTYAQGGGADATRQLALLDDVVKALKTKGANLTGPTIGVQPRAVLAVTNPNAVAMAERVEEVVQRSLRAILGAQFTEREGERLIARAYNPMLPEAENAIRVERLFKQLDSAAKSKQDAIAYFQSNGTLTGWRGKLPSLADFNPEGSTTKPITQGWGVRKID